MLNEPYMSRQERAENAKNFRLNMLIFGVGFVGLVILVAVLSYFKLL